MPAHELADNVGKVIAVVLDQIIRRLRKAVVDCSNVGFKLRLRFGRVSHFECLTWHQAALSSKSSDRSDLNATSEVVLTVENDDSRMPYTYHKRIV